jgi:peptidylprolyl isomerase
MIRNALLFVLFLSSISPALSQDKRTKVVIETDSGNIVVALYNETPLHRDNFVKLVKEGFYDGIAFHRIIENFMIQAGNPATKEGATNTADGPGYTVPAEIKPSLYHKKGALCAARQGDNVNPARASSGSQFYIVQGETFEDEDLDNFEKRINSDMRNQVLRAFFSAPENKEYFTRLKTAKAEHDQEAIALLMEEINPIIDERMEEKSFSFTPEQRELYKTTGGTPHLDMMYTVFGEVVEGLEVIDKIAAAKTKGDAPLTKIRIRMRLL